MSPHRIFFKYLLLIVQRYKIGADMFLYRVFVVTLLLTEMSSFCKKVLEKIDLDKF